MDIRLLDDATETRRVLRLFDQIWGASTPLIGVELVRAIAHGGGYVAAAYLDGQIVGGSIGFLARHRGEEALHSHMTGLLPGVRRSGLGRAIKLHQQAWAAERGLAWVTWTFDPLVRRNAWFNLRVLGAHAHEYLVDFYGPMDDAINARDESDRLLVAWSTADATAIGDEDEEDEPPVDDVDELAPGAITVSTPPDIVVLRRTDPGEAQRWRHQLRDELGSRMAEGATVTTFTRTGEYVLEP